MPIEGQEMPRGWPLGLGNLNTRLGVRENPRQQQPTIVAAQPRPHTHSSSFSSFSSSDLDTQSTASFFQDHSVSLGRLIGIGPRERGTLYFPTGSHETTEQRGTERRRRSTQEISQKICLPVLVSILVKIYPSKRNTTHQ